jgi:hypothetical protein
MHRTGGSLEGGGHTTRVIVHAEGFWCEGDIIVPRPGGYKGRVLDLLNEDRDFLALTDVLLYGTGEGFALENSEETGEPFPYDVLLVRRNAIQFVIPLD